MAIYLMNSAVMPTAGKYESREISRNAFISMINANRHKIIPKLGYGQNAELIAKWTGIKFGLSRTKTELKPGDEMLCMCLKYRMDGYKGKEVSEDDFIFFYCRFFSNDRIMKTFPVDISKECPDKCGITKDVLQENRCLACECEWYILIESEDSDEENYYTLPSEETGGL